MIFPRVILITGASSGIGAALAVGYAQAGVTLALTARHAERLEEVASLCRSKGAQVMTACVDVRDADALAAFIYTVDDRAPIDLVIANAGISAGFSNTVAENYVNADEVFAVNVGGVLNTIHPLLPRMIARGQGHIAIMSSLAGICALPSAPAYSASKAAVRYYGEALRGEVKPYGIEVSVICPGWITTPLTAKNDFPMPFEMPVTGAAMFIRERLSQKKARIAFPRRIYYPLLVIAAMPVFVQHSLMARMPKKRLKY